MISQKIENIIIKYMTKSATLSDLEILSKWVKTPENKKVFKDYVQTHYAINYSLNDTNANQTIKSLIHKIRKDKSIFYKYRLQSVFKYAAIAILFLGIGYLYQNDYFNSKTAVVIPSDKIILELENGNIEIVSEDGSTQVVDSKGNIIGAQNGNQLIYNNEIENEVLVYNTLTVPYGKRFEIQLSDGTNVHLNAGTSLKYPVKFIEGENRQVFLDGEAYFDVTKDANHPFIVNADEIDIRVLGTQFNVSSYPEDEHINTVLIEGAVSVYYKEKSYNPETATIIKPGFKASWDKNNDQTTVEKADTEIYTAWMKGRLILKEVAFNDILKKLERQYDVSFKNNNQSLENRYFTARFDIEDIHLVMENLSQYASFSYEINENQIIINQ